MQRRCNLKKNTQGLSQTSHANEQTGSCLTNTMTGGSSRSAGWINIPGDANQSAHQGVGGSEVGPGDWCNTKGRRKWRSFSFSSRGTEKNCRGNSPVACVNLWHLLHSVAIPADDASSFYILLFPSMLIASENLTLTCISFVAL